MNKGIHYVLDRQRSGGLSPDPARLACWHTTVTSAVNLAVHLGARTIGALGLDGCNAANGQNWHHAPHPMAWGRNVHRYKLHRDALASLTDPLRALGRGLYRTNPQSAHVDVPYMTIDGLLGC